jgi:hypothetical protein
MTNDLNDIHGIDVRGGRTLGALLAAARHNKVHGRPLWKSVPERLWPALYQFVWARLPRRLNGKATERKDPGPASRDGTRTAAAPGAPAMSPADALDIIVEIAEHYQRRAIVERELETMQPAVRERLVRFVAVDADDDPERRMPAYWTMLGLMDPRGHVDTALAAPVYDRAWRTMTRALARIDELARGAGARTLLVYIPTAYQVLPKILQTMAAYGIHDDPRVLTDTTYADRLKAFGDEAGIPVVDLLPVLRAHADRPLYFVEDGHWTRDGHELAATVLADYVSTHLAAPSEHPVER